MQKIIKMSAFAFVASIVGIASVVTAKTSHCVKITDLAVASEGRLATYEQELRYASNDNISGPNDQYQALNDYEKSGQYNAHQQYSAHNQYNAHNQYAAHDQYSAHQQYSAHNQYNAHTQYQAHNQYSAHNQYNKSGSGAHESEWSHSNFAFPWMMGALANKTLPSPLVVASN